MKGWLVGFWLVFGFVSALQGSATLERARQLESDGDAMGARELLARAVKDSPQDTTALTEYA